MTDIVSRLPAHIGSLVFSYIMPDMGVGANLTDEIRVVHQCKNMIEQFHTIHPGRGKNALHWILHVDTNHLITNETSDYRMIFKVPKKDRLQVITDVLQLLQQNVVVEQDMDELWFREQDDLVIENIEEFIDAEAWEQVEYEEDILDMLRYF